VSVCDSNPVNQRRLVGRSVGRLVTSRDDSDTRPAIIHSASFRILLRLGNDSDIPPRDSTGIPPFPLAPAVDWHSILTGYNLTFVESRRESYTGSIIKPLPTAAKTNIRFIPRWRDIVNYPISKINLSRGNSIPRYEPPFLEQNQHRWLCRR